MNFNEMMFNPNYVSEAYYRQIAARQYDAHQNSEVFKAERAMRDLCEAVKNLDSNHQRIAFEACLGVIAAEYGWLNA